MILWFCVHLFPEKVGAGVRYCSLHVTRSESTVSLPQEVLHFSLVPALPLCPPCQHLVREGTRRDGERANLCLTPTFERLGKATLTATSLSTPSGLAK